MTSSSAVSIAQIKKDFASWFDVADSFNNLGMQVLHAMKVDVASNQQLLAAALYGRALTSFQASCFLAERGMLSDARTVVRAAAETTIILSAVVKDASVCELLIDRHYWHHLKIRNVWLQNPQAVDIMSSHEIEKTKIVIEDIEKSHPKAKHLKGDPVNIANLAKQAGVDAIYDVVYRWTSGDAAHTSLDALIRHIRVDANNDIVGLKFGTDAADLPDTLHNAMSVLGFALNATVTIFQLTQFNNELERCVAAWQALGEPSDFKPN